MSTLSTASETRVRAVSISISARTSSAVNAWIAVLGRVLFAAIFLAAGLGHFSKETIAHAASLGVPLASLAVPASGLLALAGALSIMLGYHARIGAWMLVLFLVPVTLAMHRFWGLDDPAQAQTQLIMFMKNVSMIGGALLITQLGAGPLSLDARHTR